MKKKKQNTLFKKSLSNRDGDLLENTLKILQELLNKMNIKLGNEEDQTSILKTPSKPSNTNIQVEDDRLLHESTIEIPSVLDDINTPKEKNINLVLIQYKMPNQN